jgi:WD40 repeat protein
MEGFGTAAGTLAFSPDGQFLAAASDPRRGSQRVCVWHAGGRPGTSVIVEGPATVTFSPDSRYVAVSCADHTARLWETRASSPALILGEAAFPAAAGKAVALDLAPLPLAFSPDSRLLATSNHVGTRLWQLP